MYTHQGDKVVGFDRSLYRRRLARMGMGFHARHYFRRANQRHGTAVRH